MEFIKKNAGIILILLIFFVLIGLAVYGNRLATMHSIATIELKDGGKIVIELYHDVAPKTVENFIKLAKSGFYDGLTFHRIMKGVAIQGGDPNGDGTGGSEETIPGEFISNGYNNYLSHKAGTISMARTSTDYNSASSQFFITSSDNTSWDGDYAAFGRVIEGMDVVQRLANIETVTKEDGTETETPVEAPVIKSIKIKKYAVKYDKNNEYDKEEMENMSSNYDVLNQLMQMGYTIDEDGNLVLPEGDSSTVQIDTESQTESE